MSASTSFDQTDILTYLMTLGPFTLVLTTDPPAGTETLITIGRTDYPGYSDKTIAHTVFSSPTSANGATSISNLANIVFATPSGDGTHTIGGYAFFDTNSNMRRYGSLQSVLPIPVTGQPILIIPGVFVISES